MTVYVDSVMIPATVGRYSSRWCHLMSDQIDPAELHDFAARIGLRRQWFQPGKGVRGHDPAGDHYDVTEGKRRQAIASGAVKIDRDGFIDLMRRRRDAVRRSQRRGDTHGRAGHDDHDDE